MALGPHSVSAARARPYGLDAEPVSPKVSSPARFLLSIASSQWPTLAGGLVFGVIWMVAQAFIPVVLGEAVTAIAQRDRARILEIGLLLFGLGVVQAGAGIFRHRRAVANFLRASATVQRLVARKATELGADLTSEVAAGEVASIGANDVDRIGNIFDLSARTSGALVSTVLVAAVLLLISVPLGVLILVGMPLVGLVLGPILRPLEARQAVEREHIGAMSALASDVVVGLRVLRGLGGERVFAERFDRASENLRRVSVHRARIQATLEASQVLLPGLFVVAVVGVGAHLAIEGALSAGGLVTAYAEAAFLLLPFQTIIEATSALTNGLVSSRKVLAVLSLAPNSARGPVSEEDAGSAALAPRAAGPSEPGLSRRQPPGAEFLRDDESGVAIPRGRFVVIAPERAEVASRLADRLGRYREPLSGAEVVLDGCPLGSLPLEIVRERILVLDREPVVLAGPLGSLLDPPRSGGAATLDAALEATQAAEIVAGLPAGLDTVLPERGRTLSGGQRQRLLLAAALRADPEILVLVEPTSAVDAHSEAAIASNIGELRRGATTVVFSASPLLCEAADLVVLLDESGRAIETGSHRELLGRSGRYRALVTRDLGDTGADPESGVDPESDPRWESRTRRARRDR